MKTVLLLSGGLDSALCLHRYSAELAVTFDYGQPHKIELGYARRRAERAGIEIVHIGLPMLPKVNEVVFAGRNAVMLTLAAAVAQSRGNDSVMIGCNFSDAERFPDCRPNFIREMNAALLGAYGVRVYAPLLTMTKAQIVAEARDAGISDTWTCYSPRPDGTQCGECYSCKGLL